MHTDGSTFPNFGRLFPFILWPSCGSALMGADTSSLTHRELCITTVEILFTCKFPSRHAFSLWNQSGFLPPPRTPSANSGSSTTTSRLSNQQSRRCLRCGSGRFFFCRVGPLSSCRGEEEVLFWPILPHVGFRLGTLQGFRPAGLQSSLPQLSATASAA